MPKKSNLWMKRVGHLAKGREKLLTAATVVATSNIEPVAGPSGIGNQRSSSSDESFDSSTSDQSFEGFPSDSSNEFIRRETVDASTVTSLSHRQELLRQQGGYEDATTVLDEENENLVLSKKVLAKLAGAIMCETCHQSGQVNYSTTKLYKNLDQGFEVKCPECSEVLFSHTPQVVGEKQLTETTASLVKDSMMRGSGFAGFSSTASSLNLGSISSHRYATYVKHIGSEMLVLLEDQAHVVRQCITKDYADRGVFPDDQGILNVDVSFDGSWMTRGHCSHIGAGFVIEVYTGFIVDFEILSNFCQKCLNILKAKATPEYDILKVEHEEGEQCLKNYEGKSGGMEKEAAIRMWPRSIVKNKMRYTTFLSDGDSSAFSAVQQLEPYPGITIVKEECVNHVSKRLGNRLRNLKKMHTTDRKTTTGKLQRVSTLGGKNKLTDTVIDKLTKYFGKAIRDNVGKTIDSMKRAAYSGFLHCGSTDDRPRHALCPTGDESYCFYNRALSRKENLPSHTTMKVSFILNEEESSLILNIYKDLTSAALLEKCLMGRTQNPNEAFHSKVWKKIQKIKFYGRMTVTYAAAQTIVEHNIGYQHAEVLHRMGFPPLSTSSIQERQKKDKERKRMSTPRMKRKRSIATACEEYGPGAH